MLCLEPFLTIVAILPWALSWLYVLVVQLQCASSWRLFECGCRCAERKREVCVGYWKEMGARGVYGRDATCHFGKARGTRCPVTFLNPLGINLGIDGLILDLDI